jgi:hypothetical protein
MDITALQSQSNMEIYKLSAVCVHARLTDLHEILCERYINKFIEMVII